MHVALLTEFAATKKEPLAVLLERIHAAFLTSGLGEPSILFTFSDSPVPKASTAIDRLLRKYPEFARFTAERSVVPNTPPIRQVSNRPGSAGDRASVPFSTLLAVAAGVPKSLPFHGVSIHFHSPAFGVQFPLGNLAPIDPGVMVTDSWWINGRIRGVSALTSVDANPAGKKLPPLPERVAAVLGACGATLRLPVSKRALDGMQYRIGDAAHWLKLVDNLAAIVAELDRTFVPAIEAAAGPAPEWFKPSEGPD